MNKTAEDLEEETENILPFRRPSLGNTFNDSSKDWLKDLPKGTIFSCFNVILKDYILKELEVKDHIDYSTSNLKSTRLYDCINEKYFWVLNLEFCKQNTYVATIGVIKND